MTAPALRPLSLGEVLDLSFGLYRAKFGGLMVVSVVCQIIPSLFRVYFSSTGQMLTNISLLLLYYLLAIVLSGVGVAASTFVVSDAYLGRDISATAALGRAVGLLWRIVATSLMVSLLVGIGFMLLIVPGVILLSGLMLSTIVVVLENPHNSNTALSRSWELTKGFRGKVLLAMFCVFILLLVPTIAVVAIWSILPDLFGETGGVATEVATAVLSLFIYPFFYVVMTVLYYDLRVRKEGFDLELLASALSPP